MSAMTVGFVGAGMDLRVLYEPITKSSGNSWCWENRIPRMLTEPEEIRVTLDICHKDLGLGQRHGVG